MGAMEGDGIWQTFITVRKKAWRNEVVEFFSTLPQCVEASEGIRSAYHWARTIAALGCYTKLTPRRR